MLLNLILTCINRPHTVQHHCKQKIFKHKNCIENFHTDMNLFNIMGYRVRNQIGLPLARYSHIDYHF